MQSFTEWFEEKFGAKVPDENLNMSWFASRGIPMIVACTCCEMTMSVMGAQINREGECFCGSCAECYKDDADDGDPEDENEDAFREASEVDEDEFNSY